MSRDAIRRTGGRPTAEAAALLDAAILTAATTAFLADGYAATTIEAIARTCGVAKRTIYARWSGKPALFLAVLESLMARWLSDAGEWRELDTLEATLNNAASRVLAVALSPEAVALNRLLVAESARFPELPLMMDQAGAGVGVSRIAALLDRAIGQGTLEPTNTIFAAEQFFHLVLAGPQRRALGLGPKLNDRQVDAWRQGSVALFLKGLRS